MSFKITCESAADLTPEMYKKYKIGVLPFRITLGENDCRDGIDIHNEDLFEYFNKTKVLPKTSALNSVDYEEFFKEQNTEDEGIIHISLSSGVSSTYNNAVTASKNFKNV